MDPCLGRSSTSLMPVPATVASASRMSLTPYPTWCSPSPRRARLEQLDVTHPQRTRAGAREPGGPDGQHGLADPLLLVLLQGQHPEAERLPVHVDGTAQVAAGDADVIEAGQQR